MAFNYPIQAPTSVKPSQMTLRYKGNNAVTTSPFTREQQVHQFEGDMWEAEFTIPPSNREKAEEWTTFLTRLNGREGTFKISNPASDGPRGTANGTPEYAPVANPPYVSFDGSTDYIDVGDNVDLGNSFTWEMWIYPNDISTSDQRLLVKHDNSSNTGWYLSVADGGTGELRVRLEDTSPQQFDTGNKLDKEEWQHIAVTFDDGNDTLTFYKNGEQIQQATGVTGTVSDNTEPLGIGGDPNAGSGNSFDGLIDDVRIWSVTRQQSSIQDNLNNELTGTESGLQAYWKLDDADGAASDTVSTNSGTLNDASWVPIANDKFLVTGFNANQTDALKAGDYIEVNDEYKKVMEDVNTDARGNATVFVRPSFRSNPPDNETVVTDDPQLLMKLNEDQASWDVETVIYDGITFAAREAF